MTKAIRLLLTAGLLLGASLVASAQDSVRVNVPFDFQVRGASFPAGAYTVTRLFDDDPFTLALQGSQGQRIAFHVGLASTRQVGASLTFHRYGDSYYLGDVTTASGKFHLPIAHAERMTSRKQAASEVSVAASR